jgi:hypothetical protein
MSALPPNADIGTRVDDLFQWDDCGDVDFD